MKYRILVACGTGAVTSTHVATRIKEGLAQRGITATTSQCRINDVASNLSGIDVIVTTSRIEDEFEVPLFNGVPFLTGVGAEGVLDSISELLKNKEKRG